MPKHTRAQTKGGHHASVVATTRKDEKRVAPMSRGHTKRKAKKELLAARREFAKRATRQRQGLESERAHGAALADMSAVQSALAEVEAETKEQAVIDQYKELRSALQMRSMTQRQWARDEAAGFAEFRSILINAEFQADPVRFASYKLKVAAKERNKNLQAYQTLKDSLSMHTMGTTQTRQSSVFKQPTGTGRRSESSRLA